MEIVEEKINDVWILKPSGRIDASCSGQVKNRVLSMIDGNRNRLLLDLSEVDFIDSSGLGMLVSCLNTINKAGGLLKLCSFQENPKHVFEMTRLDRVFQVYEDHDEAISSF